MHLDTPLFESAASYSAAERRPLFKMDAMQPTGSFKLRGVGLCCSRAVEGGAEGIVCASGGNAGISAAYAAARLGVPLMAVVPETTSPQARQAIEDRGGSVQIYGSTFDDAEAFARAFAAERGAFYLHPFADPLLWEGHATLIDEIVAAGAYFDCVVTSVGGGGLLAGIAAGLDRNGLSSTPIIAVETAGAASFNAAVAAGELVTLPRINSIASSLGARRVMQHALDLTRSHSIVNLVVSDEDAVAACLKFADVHRVLVEPACGAALAALDAHPLMFARFDRPLIEICGGWNVSLDQLASWKATYINGKRFR